MGFLDTLLNRNSRRKTRQNLHVGRSEADTRTRDGLSDIFDAFEDALPADDLNVRMAQTALRDTSSAASARSTSTGLTLDGQSLRRTGKADRDQILLAWLSCQVYLTRLEHAAQQIRHSQQCQLLYRESEARAGRSPQQRHSGLPSSQGQVHVDVHGVRYEACFPGAVARPGLLQEEQHSGSDQGHVRDRARRQAGCDLDLDWQELQRGYRRSLHARAKRMRRER